MHHSSYMNYELLYSIELIMKHILHSHYLHGNHSSRLGDKLSDALSDSQVKKIKKKKARVSVFCTEIAV